MALIFPLDIWKAVVEESLKEALKLVKRKKAKIVCPDIIFDEISKNVDKISNKINTKFVEIYNEIKDMKGSFDKNNILEFRKIMDHKIFAEKKRDLRNRLFFIEGLILKEASNKLSIIDVLQNCIDVFNEINIRLVGEFANYIKDYEIQRLIISNEEKAKEEIEKIRFEVEKSVSNKSDAEILSIFINFLKEKDKKGIFVTHDFHHLLLNSIALEAIFPVVSIIRPVYVKCLVDSYN